MKLFVDTSAWLALNDRDDQYHKKAIEKSVEIKNQRIKELNYSKHPNFKRSLKHFME